MTDQVNRKYLPYTERYQSLFLVHFLSDVSWSLLAVFICELDKSPQ